jgi:hypothetical protein
VTTRDLGGQKRPFILSISTNLGNDPLDWWKEDDVGILHE